MGICDLQKVTLALYWVVFFYLEIFAAKFWGHFRGKAVGKVGRFFSQSPSKNRIINSFKLTF